MCEINESETDEHLHLVNVVEKFNRSIGQEDDHVCCASCGIIQRAINYKQIELGNHQIDHLVTDESFSKWWYSLTPIYRAAHHIKKFDNGKLYAVGYMLIDPNNNTGYYCKKCLNKNGTEKGHTKFLDFDYDVSYVSVFKYIILLFCYNLTYIFDFQH